MERKLIEITLKDGMIWTQIFNKKQEIISSFISDDEVEAMTKASKFIRANKEAQTYYQYR
jgi:hypothetical protein